jgi:VIT1/CCC1 family predicted Fe2+/Mn2+ transporter
MKLMKHSIGTLSKHHVPDSLGKTMLRMQRNEITEHIIYDKLSRSMKDAHNRKVLADISQDELRHHNFWKSHTNVETKPSKLNVWRFFLIARLFGLTFGVKLMERGEHTARHVYDGLAKHVPHVKDIEMDEAKHEKDLIGMLHEEKLKYVGSIVLGLNDALVELTGALAGLSFALQNTQLTALAGLITGVAASLSMGASEYLSTKSEVVKDGKSPIKAAVYTTITYIITVMLLVAPFFAFKNIFLSLGGTLAVAVAAILLFTFYISVANDLPFRRRFAEMLAISMGVAGVSFVIGVLIKLSLNVSV